MIRTTIAAISLTAALTTSAAAATLSGVFSIDIYQNTASGNTGGTASATPAALGSATLLETITYNGELDFGTFDGSDSTTIDDWLATGGGTYFISGATGDLQLSKPNIGNNTATTTFFDIVGVFASAFDSVVRHDDGISVYDDGGLIAASAAPTTVINTNVNGFDGGEWRLIYAATNGDPSVLRVTGDNLPTTVPLPAAGWLLLAGLGGMAALRRRNS